MSQLSEFINPSRLEEFSYKDYSQFTDMMAKARDDIENAKETMTNVRLPEERANVLKQCIESLRNESSKAS